MSADVLIFNLVRRLKRRWSGQGMAALTQAEVDEVNAVLRDWKRAHGDETSPSEARTAPPSREGLSAAAKSVLGEGASEAQPAGPLKDIPDLQSRLDVAPDGDFGPASRAALFARLSNRNAPALTEAEFAAVASELGVPVKLIKAVRKVEAPRGPFDDEGRPSILYEKHVFARSTTPKGRFNRSHPSLSATDWQPGTYGSYGEQYDKLAAACALDPEAAFRACSWGAFQVLGENAIAIGYPSAFDMALALTKSEAAHLDSFARFVKANSLAPLLRLCRAGDPASCEPFVAGYNGKGYRKNNYHVKLAEAAR